MPPVRALSISIPFASLAAALLVAGCGAGEAIDHKKAETWLRFDVQEATGEQVEKVTCPPEVPISVGTRFTCHVVSRSGDDAVVELEITSDKGDLRALSLEAPED